MQILRLALPVPLRRHFDYLPPKALPDPANLTPGVRVKAPFGPRQLVGILLEVRSDTDVPASKLRAATEVLDETPPLPPHLHQLSCWAAGYYQHPVGDAYTNALPALLRKGQACEYQHEHLWRATEGAKIEGLGKTAHRQRELLQLLIEHPKGISEDALRLHGANIAALKPLVAKGMAESFIHHPEPLHARDNDNILHVAPLTLNDEQQAALNTLHDNPGFQTLLIDGVTGSGKTEVYLQAIEQALRAGKQALVLVPEIGLTPQTLARFKARFSVPVLALHSNMTDRQRLDAWLQAREGLARIIIGTRSAIFTPLAAPGIIIVDEEHDASFKQHEGFRYHARDLAVMRARAEQVPLLLGSATPSLESLHNARSGRYKHLLLTKRAGDAKAPSFELMDIRNQPLTEGLAPAMLGQIKQHLDAGTQVLVFLNRRGFSPSLMCEACGAMVDCQRCDAHMTLHRRPPHMHCHHCDSQQPVPQFCTECGSHELKPMGAGTERTEDALERLFPQVPVLRVDRDSTARKDAMRNIMQQVNSGEPCILVGTQMLAKGHHFPKVTLVVILNADGGLFSADYRGMERTAQLILQVAGRAGRAEHPGHVVLQTQHAEHPVLQSLVHEGYQAFAEQELQQRSSAGLPPFSHSAILRAETNKPGTAESFLAAVRQQLTACQPEQVLCAGPFPSVMEKRAGMYRAQLHIQSRQRAPLHWYLEQACQCIENSDASHRVRWTLDVDPADSY